MLVVKCIELFGGWISRIWDLQCLRLVRVWMVFGTMLWLDALGVDIKV